VNTGADTRPHRLRYPWFALVADDLGSLVDPIGFDRWSFTPTLPFASGYQQALRERLGGGADDPGGLASHLRLARWTDYDLDRPVAG